MSEKSFQWNYLLRSTSRYYDHSMIALPAWYCQVTRFCQNKTLTDSHSLHLTGLGGSYLQNGKLQVGAPCQMRGYYAKDRSASDIQNSDLLSGHLAKNRRLRPQAYRLSVKPLTQISCQNERISNPINWICRFFGNLTDDQAHQSIGLYARVHCWTVMSVMLSIDNTCKWIGQSFGFWEACQPQELEVIWRATLNDAIWSPIASSKICSNLELCLVINSITYY